MPDPKHRRIVLIDTRFQLKMAGAFLLLQVLLTGLLSLALYLFMDSELKAGLASAHAAYRSLDQMLLPLVAVLAGFSLLLSTVIVTVFVVFLSHRIAGPLYRFRSVLEGLGQRRLPQHTAIRPDDQLGEISDTLTHAVATLGADLAALSAAAEAIRRAHTQQDWTSLERNTQALEAILKGWELPPKRD